MTRDLAIYLASFVDGEGSLTINTQGDEWSTMNGKITVGNTDPTIPKLFHETFGGTLHLRKAQNEKSKRCWQWVAQGRAIIPIIQELRPFLRMKQAQADIVLEFCKTLNRPGHKLHDDSIWVYRYKLLDMLAELNRKGVQSDRQLV